MRVPLQEAVEHPRHEVVRRVDHLLAGSRAEAEAGGHIHSRGIGDRLRDVVLGVGEAEVPGVPQCVDLAPGPGGLKILPPEPLPAFGALGVTRVEHAEQGGAGILGDDRARRVRIQERSVDIDSGVDTRIVEDDLRGRGSADRMTEHPDPVGIDGRGKTVRQ